MQHAGSNYKASILGLHTCPTPWNNIANWLENANPKTNITYERASFGILENENNITAQAKNYIFIAT